MLRRIRLLIEERIARKNNRENKEKNMSKKPSSIEPKQKAKKLKLKKETIKDLEAGDKAAQAKGAAMRLSPRPCNATDATKCSNCAVCTA